MNVLRFFALLFLSLLAGRNAEIKLSLRPAGLFAAAKIRLFGLLPVKTEASLRPVYPLGWVLRVGGLPPRVLKKREKKGRTARFPLRALRVKRLAASGVVGIRGEPHLTALLCGALNALSSMASSALAPENASAFIEPDFAQSVFALNVEGMFCLYPAKILAEALKKEN
ncbi:MAG: hypothetical protein IKS43_02405 [Clostridia bacterium]|nr:hypothetical protein [Clostridia bacterium]